MTPLFVYASDTHMQPFAWSRRPEIAGDADLAWEQLTLFCERQRLPLVLGGDIFDSNRPDPRTVQNFLIGARRIRLHYIQGDHDRQAPAAWPDLGEHHHLHRTTTVFNGITVTGLDWTPAHQLPEALKTLRQADIVVTHQTWRELLPFGTGEGSIADFPYACTMLAGDVHIRKSLTVPLASDPQKSVVVHSAGSTAMQAIDEADAKYVLVVGYDVSGIQVQEIRLTTRRRYNLSGNSVDEILREVANHIDAVRATTAQDLAALAASEIPRTADDIKPLLRVAYPRSVAGVDQAVAAAFGADFHLFWNPLDDTVTQHIDYAAGVRSGAFDSLADAVCEMRPAGDAAAARLTALLRTNDQTPTVALAAMREQFINDPGEQAAGAISPHAPSTV